jgi:succinyl-CoA synthetase beta subunit
MFRMVDLPFVDDKSPAERAAADLGLSFVELDGDIAVMANGAGITMGTLDTLAAFGGTARNFLDAGGGTGREQTAKALKILLGLKPKSMFINIFGGITRCDDVANAFKDVSTELGGFPIPVVIRLVGTNQEAGREILKSIGIEAFDFMQDAAKRVIELTK